MNPLYPLSSFMEKQEQQEEQDPNLKLYIFSSSTTSQAAAAAASSQLAFASCFDQRGKNLHHQSLHQLPHDHQAEAEKSNGGLSRVDTQVIFSSTSLLKSSLSSTEEVDQDQIGKLSDNGSAAKYWMSSKMRVMQKMMINPDKKSGANSDHKPGSSTTTRNYHNNNDMENKNGHRHGGKWEILGRSSSSCSNGHNNGVRVCSDCNTTTTPLWRSGPQGPKSLCNACGIRQRKARRAMAEAAAASGGGGGSEAASGKQLHKEKKSRTSCHGDTGIEKNKMMGSDHQSSWECQSEGGTTKVSFDHHNFTLRLRKSSTGSAFGRVFPRDEEEAAILLMELSCGLVHTC